MLDWLDPLKGLAIAGIVLYHVTLLLYGIPPFDHVKETWLPLAERLAQLSPLPNESLAASLLTNAFRYSGWLGYQGVSLFLTLSGFGLTYSLARRSAQAEINLGEYFKRRALRLLPVYWAAHAFFLLFNALTGQPHISPADSHFYLSLAGLRFLPDTFYYVSPAWWYVWLILQFYVAFPWLWRWLRRRGLKEFWIGALALTLAARTAALLLLDGHLEMLSMGAIFVTRLFEFGFGMGLAYRLSQQPDALDRFARKRWAAAAALIGYLAALACSLTREGQIVAHALYGVCLFWIAYSLTRWLAPRARPPIRALAWLGRQSYPLMILHQPILWWFIPLGLALTPSYPLFLVLLAGFTVVVVLGAGVLGATVDRLTESMARRVAWLRDRLGRPSPSLYPPGDGET